MRLLACILAMAQATASASVGTVVIRDLRGSATVTPELLENDLGQELIPEVGVRCEGDGCPVLFLKTADDLCTVRFSRTSQGTLQLTRGGFDVRLARSSAAAVVRDLLAEAGLSSDEGKKGVELFRERGNLAAVASLGERSLVLEITARGSDSDVVRVDFSVENIRLPSAVVP